MSEKSNGQRIRKMFITNKINQYGLYALKMYKNGVELVVVVDDYICCKWSKPCFTRAKGNELWVGLAEKAWAKVHGSYHQTNSGLVIDTLRDLTGAPSKSYYVADYPDMFERLVKANEKNYIVAASFEN